MTKLFYRWGRDEDHVKKNLQKVILTMLIYLPHIFIYSYIIYEIWKTSDFRLPDSYSVKRVKDETADKSLQQKAMDFIQSRLYGPGTKRTTSRITHFVIRTIFQTKFSRKTNISVYIYLQMPRFCPSKGKGVSTKGQLWSLRVKNWVSGEIFMFNNYFLLWKETVWAVFIHLQVPT